MLGLGFEPNNSGVKWTACPHQLSATVQPSKKAGDGTRTHDNLIGNQILYQLSYTRIDSDVLFVLCIRIHKVGSLHRRSSLYDVSLSRLPPTYRIIYFYFYNSRHVYFIPNSMQVNLVAIQSKNQKMRMRYGHAAFLHH